MKDLLTEAQRIAYVGLCLLASQEVVQCLKVAKRKELKASITDMFLKIMGPLYYRMELKMQGVCVFLTSRNNVRPAEFALIKQKMINSRTGWPPIWSGADDQNTILRRPVGRQKRRSKTLLQIQWTLTTSRSQINRSSTSLCLHRIPKQKIRPQRLLRLICLHLLYQKYCTDNYNNNY